VAHRNNRGMRGHGRVNTDIKHQGSQGKKGRDLAGIDAEAVISRDCAWKACRQDIQPIRLQFSDQRGAPRARRRTPMWLSAEPRAGISLANGTAGWSSSPYFAPIGPSRILSASEKAVKSTIHPARGSSSHRHAPWQASTTPWRIPGEIVERRCRSSAAKNPSSCGVPNVNSRGSSHDVFHHGARQTAYTTLMFGTSKSAARCPTSTAPHHQQFMWQNEGRA